MNRQLLAIGLAALVVTVGAAAAVGSTLAQGDDLDTRDANIDATYDNGTVTATITNGGDPVENATVEIGDEEYTTGENGTVTADITEDEDEVEIKFETEHIEGKSEYAIVDGELVLQEEEFEYEVEDAEDDDDEAEDADADEDEESDAAEEADDDAEEAEDDETDAEADDDEEEDEEASDDDETEDDEDSA